MKEFRKRIVVLIVLTGIVISKGYCFVIVNRIYHEINEFRKLENRYYTVMTVKNGNIMDEQEISCKDNQIKYFKLNKNTEGSYFEFKDFDEDKNYFWVIKEDGSKNFNQNGRYIKNKNFIIGIPNLISKVYKNNEFNLKYFLKIHYIISAKYEGKSCYKIVTKLETIIIDKNTYLPIYVCENWVNSEDDNSCKMEYFYGFEINTVTEEDMQKL